MKTIRVPLFIIISLFFLSGCVNKEDSESILLNIPNVSEYTLLHIQPIDEKGGTSEANETIFTDKKQILDLINKVNKMEVVKSPSKDYNERVKKTNKQQSYLVSLIESEDSSDKMFHMIFFKDGSINFQYYDKNKQKNVIYLSKDKHPKLLEEFK